MLTDEIQKVREKKNDLINQRLKQFQALKKASNNELFNELCFCLLTANFSAERSIKIQKQIGDGFLNLNEQELASQLKSLGYRFPNIRAKYIIEARESKDSLILERNWLVNNIKGLGMKEASHFLRNIGFTNYAIIDFHIIDLLVKHDLIKKPKTLTKNKYLEIEEKLRIFNENLAELDLILWYLETGKILK